MTEIISNINIYNELKRYQEWNLPVFPCKGKVPLIRNWTNRDKPTDDEINDWIDKYDEINIGMTLGTPSQIVGIDQDGERGLEILNELSQGDIPTTWQFSTPSGGMRYLYRIPTNIQGLKKFSKVDTNESHSECALLGEGQMTIMPPSVGLNGVRYEWINHPIETELADAPYWMLNLMKKNNQSRETLRPEITPLATLSKSCPAFKEDFKLQKDSGLDYDTWFNWISLLTNLGHSDSAELFSKLSYKHDLESKERLEKLKKNPIKGLTKCMTLGCNEQQVLQCFNNDIRLNKNGEIQNSPGSFLLKQKRSKAPQWSKDKLRLIGFNFHKSGSFKGINGNVFARHLLQNLDLLHVAAGERFFTYENGIWIHLDKNNLSRKLRDILHGYLPDVWSIVLEDNYINALKVEAKREEILDSKKGYINLANGMLDIINYQLIPHDKKYYSSIRVPIMYDPNANCPQFMKFLHDIFEGDQERISIVGEVLGYCLTNENKAQKAILFFGRGSNGKSVLADILASLCGEENVSSVPLQELDNSFARYELVDKLVNIATENEISKDGLNTQYFKSIVSGDPIRVEKKHEQGYAYRPKVKLVFALNNLPYSRDKSFGFERRLLIVPFNRTFTKGEKDPGLIDKLKSELPGILNFAIKGLERLRQKDYEFTESRAVNEAVKEYTETLNPLASFVSEKFVSTKNELDKVSHDTISRAYQKWCSDNGHSSDKFVNSRSFITKVKDTLKDNNIPFGIAKGGNKRYITGVKFKIEQEVDEEPSIDDL
ncbi:phage/plasmid primase, P4 family [Bacillus salitolerans]|uniref:Phage/plasmid primase, P4 family n=1 Tax=Bacillus salitolerans TaxID=1437434 RepID=A0ABW4LIZ1_9BACI